MDYSYDACVDNFTPGKFRSVFSALLRKLIANHFFQARLKE